MNPPGQASLEQVLLAWAGDVAGGTVSTARALVGGNRRRAWAVDVLRPDGQILALFLRFASSDLRPTADPYTLRREASVYRALAATSVAIARVYGTHPTHEAMLLERIEGDTAYRAIGDETQRRAVAEGCVRELHRLHALDARTLDLPLLGPVADIATAVRRELAIWRGMYVEAGRGDPLIELAFGLLSTSYFQ